MGCSVHLLLSRWAGPQGTVFGRTGIKCSKIIKCGVGDVTQLTNVHDTLDSHSLSVVGRTCNPALGRWRQAGHKFKVILACLHCKTSLGYVSSELKSLKCKENMMGAGTAGEDAGGSGKLPWLVEGT